MKTLTFLIMILATMVAFGQSGQSAEDKQWRQEMTIRNGFPATPTPSTYNKNRVEDAMKSFPVIMPHPREMTKEELKDEEALNVLRAPRPEDLTKYSEFLKQKKTGIVRLFPDLGCAGKLLVDAADDCAKAISLSWSYSFIYKYYGNSNFYDLRFKDNNLVVDGFLSQGIIAPLGDIELKSVSLTANGMKYLKDFKPEKKSKKAKAQFAEISKKISADGYVYGKMISLQENQTYAMRLVDYHLSNQNKIEPTQTEKVKSKEDERFYQIQYFRRRDKIIAFRLIRKDDDGSVTILWKELSDKKAPFLVFDKKEKLTDLKIQ